MLLSRHWTWKAPDWRNQHFYVGVLPDEPHQGHQICLESSHLGSTYYNNVQSTVLLQTVL